MKKQLLYVFMAVCLFAIFKSKGQPYQPEFANYITISNGEFKDGSNVFKPLCINYLVDYDYYIDSAKYYIAPHFCYSNVYRDHKQTKINDNSAVSHWGYGDNGKNEMDSAKIKLNRDLKKIDSLGFNVVRLRPSISWRNNILHIPTGSYTEYFRLTDSLIAKCTALGLRVIMVLSDDTNTYKQFDQYCIYLDSVTSHYSNNKTVMAYVVYMEPSYKWKNAKENDKIMISNWSRKWYYLIKKNAPNQLISYGLDGIKNILFWDPAALTYDFLSMHFYYGSSYSFISTSAVNSYFKWMNDNVNDLWVLGETGFSGTNSDICIYNIHSETGTENDQFIYADNTMQKALECGCKGYSWWQYQDVKWNSCLQNYFGLITYYPVEGLKKVHSLFPTYKFRIAENPCNRPDSYYNIPDYPSSNFSGMVQDQNSDPISDALVIAWSNTNKSYYSTFTDSQGEYTIHTPQDTVVGLVWISHKGYTDKNFFHTNSFESTTLTRINYNKWKKNWTNENYPAIGDTLIIHSQDTVVIGNFYGDEAQEVFVISTFSQTAALYQFHTNHWEKIWDGTIGDWQFSIGDKFYAGDFNGNGYDDLLCLQNTTQPLASIFSYDPQTPITPWISIWSNLGNGNIGNWNYQPGDVILPGYFNDSIYCSLMCIRNQDRRKRALCQQLSSGSWVSWWTATNIFNDTYIGSWCLGVFDNYYVGDFSGDGIDELFCTQVTNGTTNKMRLMQYNNSWSSLWTNNGISEGVGIYPYRANLHVGNFDSDRADELLGVGTWATKFDFSTSSEWNWSWSTYESGRLSDWTVNPSHRMFFMKVMTDVPGYLFVSRWISNNDFRFNAYSYDP